MEIDEDDGEDTEVDTNIYFGVCSKSWQHEGFDNNESGLEETLRLEYQGDTNYIVD